MEACTNGRTRLSGWYSRMFLVDLNKERWCKNLFQICGKKGHGRNCIPTTNLRGIALSLCMWPCWPKVDNNRSYSISFMMLELCFILC